MKKTMDSGHPEAKTKEIVITGFGGQGIVLAGRILAAAAALGDRRQSTLIQSYGPRAEIGWDIRMGDVVLPIDTAIHCGLIITEIVTNSLKYAFPEGWSCRKERGEVCRISLSMNEKDGFIILNASDNGTGIPLERTDPGPRSLGLTLIRILAKNQLHGDVKIGTTGGTSFEVRFVRDPDWIKGD